MNRREGRHTVSVRDTREARGYADVFGSGHRAGTGSDYGCPNGLAEAGSSSQNLKEDAMVSKEMTEPLFIRHSVEKAHIWLNDVADALGTEDRDDAYHALRAVLHTLRDRLAVNEVAQLAAQLPILVRGIFYEGWKPSRTPMTYRDVDTFLEKVGAELGSHGETEASFAVTAVSRVLAAHVSEGELDDVRAELPADLRALFES